MTTVKIDGIITGIIIVLVFASTIFQEIFFGIVCIEIAMIFLAMMLHFYFENSPSLKPLQNQLLFWCFLIVVENAAIIDCPQSGIWAGIILWLTLKSIHKHLEGKNLSTILFVENTESVFIAVYYLMAIDTIIKHPYKNVSEFLMIIFGSTIIISGMTLIMVSILTYGFFALHYLIRSIEKTPEKQSTRL